MKMILCAVLCGVAATGLATIGGCKTSEAGVKTNYRSQWTTMAGDPIQVSDAAKAVLEDLKLQKIESKATGVDGVVSGYTADNTKVNINIQKAGDTTSEVSVNVGALGDPGMGKDIINRIQKKLG